MRLIRACVLAVVAVCLASVGAAGQGTTLTYQGKLDSQGAPYSGTADFRFRIFLAPAGGSILGEWQQGANVVDGLFTAHPDFGPTLFNSAGRYMEIAVRTPAWDGFGPEPEFFTFPERQPITPAPFSLHTRGVYVDADQNVGIGTAQPDARLTVMGNTRLHGPLEVAEVLSAQSNLEVLGPTVLFGSLRATRPATFDNSLQTFGTATFSGVMLANGPAHFGQPPNFYQGLTSLGPVQSNGALTVNAPASVAGELTAAGLIRADGGIRFADGTVMATAPAGPQLLTAVASLDYPLIGAGDGRATTFAVPGVGLGDPVIVGYTFNEPFSPLQLRRAYVSSVGFVTVEFANQGIFPIDPPLFLMRVIVFKY